jgi:hypothetical protein
MSRETEQMIASNRMPDIRRLVLLTVMVFAIGGVSVPVASASEPVAFGIESVNAEESSSAAGMHPDLTTKFVFKHIDKGGLLHTTGRVENVSVSLPPGLVGDPNNFPRCSTGQFNAGVNCPIDSQVGIVKVVLEESEEGEVFTEPLYNLEPPRPSMVARLGFPAAIQKVFIDVSVRTGSDYGVTATVHQATGQSPIIFATTTLWGSPADPSHDEQRLTVLEALNCSGVTDTACEAPEGKRSSGLLPVPFLSNPTACEDQPVGFTATSYQHPGEVFSSGASLPQITGCEAISFQPSLRVEPSSHQAGAPTGLSTVLKIPQTNAVDRAATSAMRDAKVTLPAGMTVNAGVADGLQACSAEQVGLGRETQSGCPDGAKIGSVTLVSPDLAQPLHGAIYQRAQGEEGHTFGLWLVSDELGLHLKIPGVIEADPKTGQLTTVFANTPQVPVEEIDLQFKGGSRAPLKNPDACGTYGTRYELTPWSGNAPVVGESVMNIDEGCSTGAFNPKLSAGSTNPESGVFSPFALTLTQESLGEQDLAGLSVTLPPGVSAKLAGVARCPDAQAATGACPAGSKIGSVTVAAGPGSSPLWIPQPGKSPTAVFLTGPYKGAPFGLSIVVPAQAGPFDLGNVVVRAAINIDPVTARVSVVSDPLPQILEGVPVSYRTVHVDIDRSGFTFNPTNCNPMTIAASATSIKGTVANLTDHFQAADCASLAFKPVFKVSTSAKTSKANGASLNVKLIPPAEGPQTSGGSSKTEANLAMVKVELPKALPSRLTTLQKACTEAQFATNPAGCPPESIVGAAVAHTPLLDNPLTGPAYFVSHGGKAFPQLILVLQGEGITIDLAGDTFISKAGITSSTFANIPDVPVSSFELNLPQGRFSALTANGDLCAQKLVMPTTFTAQNGAQTHQTTPITVEGCSNTLTITSHTVKGRTLTLSVYTPAAGRLTATGKGLKPASKTAKGHETLTLKLTQKTTGKLRTTVRVTYTPNTGKERKKQTKTLTIKLNK